MPVAGYYEFFANFLCNNGAPASAIVIFVIQFVGSSFIPAPTSRGVASPDNLLIFQYSSGPVYLPQGQQVNLFWRTSASISSVQAIWSGALLRT